MPGPCSQCAWFGFVEQVLSYIDRHCCEGAVAISCRQSARRSRTQLIRLCTAAAVALCFAGPALAQTWPPPPAACSAGWFPSVTDPNTCPQSGFASRCFNGVDPRVIYSVPWPGYPLNFAAWQRPAPASLPPVSLDPRQSTLALVARSVPFFQGPNPKAERPALNGVLDLTNGNALLREVDFELPFGNAIFRHIRTYADPTSTFNTPVVGGQNDSWDWNGYLWMMSESPLLLVDAAYAEIGLDPNDPNAPIPQYSYLILDAHQTIPFKKVESDYVADPWIDAILEQGTDPNQYHVWLNRQSVTYTFQLQVEEAWTSSDCNDVDPHAPPPSGQGIPHFAFLTKIEDRYGNRAEITHPALHQQQFDVPGATCDICVQNCNEKGQVATVKLFHAGNDPADWTLFYTYRPFSYYELYPRHGEVDGYPDLWRLGGFEGWYLDPGMWFRLMPTQLHSIHVYEGDVSAGGFVPTLPVTAFYCEPDPNAPIDPNDPNVLAQWPALDSDPNSRVSSFDDYELVENETLPQNEEWVVRVVYVYSEPVREWYEFAPYESQYERAFANASEANESIYHVERDEGARLLKTSVTQRDPNNSAATRTRHTLYRHDFDPPGPGPAAVFYDDVLAAIERGSRLDPNGDPDYSVNELLTIGLDDLVFIDTPHGIRRAPLRRCASLSMPYCDAFALQDQWYKDRVQGVGLSTTFTGARPFVNGDAPVRWLVDRRNGSRRYELMSFVVYAPPDSSAWTEWSGLWNGYGGSSSPTELHPPYRTSYQSNQFWPTYFGSCFLAPLDQLVLTPPPLDKEYYVTVVDEWGTKPDPNEEPDDPNMPMGIEELLSRRAGAMVKCR